MNDTFKKMIATIAILCAVGSVIAGCGGSTSTAHQVASTSDPTTAPKIQANETTRISQEQMIADVEKHLSVSKDGKLVLDTPLTPKIPGAYAPLSPDETAFAAAAVTGLNDKVASGEVVLHDDLTVSPAGLNAHANASGVTWYWWGVRVALNNYQTQRLIAALTVGAGVASILPIADVIAGVYAIGAGVVAWCDAAGRGVFIYYNWWTRATWITSQ